MLKTLLLAVPPQAGLLEGFSSGIISLGSYISVVNTDTQVKFVDFSRTSLGRLSDQVCETLTDISGPVFVGITGTTASYQSMLQTAQAFKQHDSNVITILGGHHATPQDDVILRRHPYVDFIIRGEGEIGLSRLLHHPGDLTCVPNLSFRDGSTVIRTPDAPLLDQVDLDQIDSTVGIDQFHSPPGKFNRVTYVSARGCPLKCSFCAVRASTIRTKSIPAVIQDLRYLVLQQGHDRVAIEDNFFAHQRRRTLELCAAIERLQEEKRFTWDCQTRVESMRRPDVVTAMARANCDAAYLGVESLVGEHLLFLRKTSKPDAYLEMLETEVIPKMLTAGIDAYIMLQLGIPGEEERHRASTLKRLERLGRVASQYGRQIAIHPQLHVIYPGTPHFDMSVAAGTFGKIGYEIFEEFAPWEANHKPILKYLGKHFAHGVGGIPISILEADALRRGQFEIAGREIFVLSDHLTKMSEIPGITVFQYGDYLAMPG
jgi:anaerobic magnesium-protoporphyrin IX monomethyl ester cyclase